MESLLIAPCTPHTLAQLAVAMPSQHHRTRFAVQLDGEGVFLVALLTGVPAGHVLLRWRTRDETLLRSGIAEPNVEALAVAPARRRQGVATALMLAAEQAARERGYVKIGLEVGITNAPARALYHRLGYREADLAPFDVTWSCRDDRGAERIEGETCTYFTKRLVP